MGRVVGAECAGAGDKRGQQICVRGGGHRHCHRRYCAGVEAENTHFVRAGWVGGVLSLAFFFLLDPVLWHALLTRLAALVAI